MHKLLSVLFIGFALTACGGAEQGESIQLPPVTAVITAPEQVLIAGDTVRLSGSTSQSGGKALSYAWSLTSKPANSAVQLNSASAAELQFVADIAGNYVVTLEVTAGTERKTTSVTLDVKANQSPELKLSYQQDQVMLVGKTFVLDASMSVDPEQRPLSYNWQLVSQPMGSSLNLAQAGSIEFSPTVAGEYVIELNVRDGVNVVSRTELLTVFNSERVLSADPTSALNAEEQLLAFFGEGSLDLPITHDAEHVQLANEPAVGEHFVFIAHLKEDGDRTVPFGVTDRQRTEVKSYNLSADELVCRQDDHMRIAFTMKADSLNLSTSFTHLFQLKGQSELPLITLSAQRTDLIEALRVKHYSGNQTLAAVDWKKANNRWLDVVIAFQCTEQGYLKVQVKDVLTKELYLDVNKSGLSMWQGVANDLYGMKAGLYRRIKDDCISAPVEDPKSCHNAKIKDGLESEEDSVRIGDLSISKY